MTRRDALAAIAGFLGAAAAAACGSPGKAGADGGGGRPDSGGRPDAAPPDAQPIDAQPIDAAEEACPTSTLSAEELLAGIDTFVVLCMENRSFDHYLGSLSLIEGRAEVDGLTGSESNPDPDGNPVGVHVLDTFTPADPPHSWGPCHDQWDDGANDGFVKAHAGSSQDDVMGYYLRWQLPITYALADQAALCDRWHCSLLGPTWPNRFYLHGATSMGQKGNLPVAGFTSIFSRLNDAGVSNMNYHQGVAWATGGYLKLDNLAGIDSFFDAAAAGTLPQFSLIDPQFYGNGANDDHPDHDVRMGQALIASVVAALAQSPQWERCLLAITYDEHGGFFDHVSPPECVDEREEFQRLGFRVPGIVVGPHVKRGCVVHDLLEHVSVAATLTRRFGLEPLNDRVAATADLSVCIDERRLSDPLAPPVLPPVPMSRVAWRQRPPSTAHAELAQVLDQLHLPPEIDGRAQADAITERFLARAEKLGAIRFID